MPVPKTIVWDATYACPLKCKFCFASKAAASSTTQRAKKIISGFASRGAKTLVFSGGDPFCRNDLPALLEHAKSLGLKTIVHTTGLVPKAVFQKALPFIDRINLPLDSGRTTHAKVRGSAKHFDAVISLLKFLRLQKKPASITTLVCLKNKNKILQVGKLICKFENIVLWRLLEFRATGGAKKMEKKFALKKGEFEKIERQVKEFAEKNKCKARLQFVPAVENDFDSSYRIYSPSGKLQNHLPK